MFTKHDGEQAFLGDAKDAHTVKMVDKEGKLIVGRSKVNEPIRGGSSSHTGPFEFDKELMQSHLTFLSTTELERNSKDSGYWSETNTCLQPKLSKSSDSMKNNHTIQLKCT